jgi:hypothetical protein
MTLRIFVRNLPLAGMYLTHTNPVNGLITSMVFGQPTFSPQEGVAFGQYAVTLKPPAALGSGIFTDSVDLRACFDQACTQEVPNSRYTLSFRILVPATEGVEFTRRSFTPTAGGATNLAWSAARQSLYVISSEFASNGASVGIDPTVFQINPVTMATGATTVLPGENLRYAATTDDGAFLYVTSQTQPLVHRLPLPSLAPDFPIALGSFSAFEPYLVNDIATLPGQSQSFVAAVAHNNSHGGTRVYDNAVARPETVAPVQAFEEARWLVPDVTSGTFVSQSYGPSNPQVNNLERLSVDASGIHVASSAPTASGIVVGRDRPQRAGSRLFLQDGRILDASSGALLGSLALPDSSHPLALLVDEGLSRVFVWQGQFILSYDLATLKFLAFAPVYGPGALQSIRGSMVRWGDDGIALVDGNALFVLTGPFFTTYRGAPTM